MTEYYKYSKRYKISINAKMNTFVQSVQKSLQKKFDKLKNNQYNVTRCKRKSRFDPKNGNPKIY